MLKFEHVGALFLAVSGSLFAYHRLESTQEPVRPTKEHELLARDVGTWKGEFKMSVAPNAPVMVGSVTAEISMHGEFWQVTKLEGDVGGMLLKGINQLGYDPAKKKYISTWIDNMSPALSIDDGHWDAEKRQLYMEHTGPDMAGFITKQWQTTTYDDAGGHLWRAFRKTPGGEDHMWMEIAYTRSEKKASGR